MPFDSGDIILVPFPFTDRSMRKRRPALVLSKTSFNVSHMHLILAMVTSAKNPPWPSDIKITDQESTGLPQPSVVRLKLFTLDERLVIDRLGKLSRADRSVAMKRIASTMGISSNH